MTLPLRIFLIASALFFAYPQESFAQNATAETAQNERFFSFSDRIFSQKEAAAIAGVPVDAPDIKTRLQKQLPMIATIVICERSGIKLSPESTAKSLEEALLMLDQNGKEKFQQQLAAESLTCEQWVKKQSLKIEQQTAEAVRRWYIKKYSKTTNITSEHISNYYFRNLTIFRRTLVDPDKVWVYNIRDGAKIQQAHALIMQGASRESICKTTDALQLPPEELVSIIKNNLSRQKALDKNYSVLNSGKYVIMFANDALTQTYLPLDEKLSRAISNTLYDAWGKAMLAKALKKELAQNKLLFF